MIKKWEIINSPRPDDDQRYKVLLEGDHNTIIRALKKIDHMCGRPLCGRPFGQTGKEYNWAFYVYKTKEEERKQIEELLQRIRNSEEEALIIEKAAEITMQDGDISSILQEEEAIPIGVALNERYIFDNFVVAQNNHFAQAAALAAAESPGKVYNPLFIYGKVGLGKTHLMEAIGHYVLEHNPRAKVVYTSTEKFIAEVINAIRDGKIMELRNRYRNLDLLLVDDVQFLSEAEAAQEEFFHTFNALYDAHKQIVLTSDKPPKKIAVLEERLRSRFEWGLIADLQVPNLETRVAILQKKAQIAHLSIPDEILFYIAEKLSSNIRELEGFLIRIAAYATLTERELNRRLAEELIKDLLPYEEEEDIPPVELEFPSAVEVKEVSEEEIKEEVEIVPETEVKAPEETSEEIREEEEEREEKEGPSVDLSLRAIKVAYLYPEEKGQDLKTMKKMFESTLNKHKIKFRLETGFEESYQSKENVNFQELINTSKEKQIDVVIALGPASGNLLFKENLSRALISSFEREKIPIQIIPFRDISKQYRYLDVCLDLAFLKK